MTFRQQIGFWLSALLAFVVSLWLLQDILLPFIAGFVLAYFLDPVADALERAGLSRLFATLLILLAAVAGIVILVLVVAPVLAEQALLLANDLPGLIQSLVTRLDEVTPQRLKDLLAKNSSDASGSIGDIAGQATGFVATLAKSLLSGGMAIVNVLSLLVVTPIVAFYLLLDWDDIVAKIDGWLPRDHAEEIRTIGRDINVAMAGFIRGQGTVCLLLGVFYAIGLSLLGLKSLVACWRLVLVSCSSGPIMVWFSR
jgi:predicted PurR-regulated permease PerM